MLVARVERSGTRGRSDTWCAIDEISLGGGTFFFTITVIDRRSRVLTDHLAHLREAFREARHRRPFSIDAIVVLPEHLHIVMTLPPDNANFSARWGHIKGLFTRRVIAKGATIERDRKGEYGLWQKRFWEHTIRDDRDLERHIDYIHFNPMKHGLVSRVGAWPYSSFHRYVKRGLLPRIGEETSRFQTEASVSASREFPGCAIARRRRA